MKHLLTRKLSRLFPGAVPAGAENLSRSATVAAFLVVLLGLAGCGGLDKSVCQPPGLADFFQCEPVPGVDSGYLCAVSPENSYPHWYMVDRDYMVKVDIGDTLYRLAGFSVSPDGRFVSVESTGEGHPILQVYAIGGYMHSGFVEFLQGWDPYPGWIQAVGWRGQVLTIESNVPLHTDYDRTGDFDESRIYRFQWSVDQPELKLVGDTGASGKDGS